MDKVVKYRKIVRALMQKQADIRANRKGIETQFNINEKEGHFQLVNVGWRENRRYYGCFLHIDVKANGKVYLQHDGTDLVVAQMLVDAGIPKEDIVLAFQPPSVRKHIEGFALA